MARLSRSENMSRIRSRDTGPEVRLRKALWRAGLRYRLHYKLPGRPDLAFVAAKVAVFVDGCFWHGCPIHYSAPSTRQELWAEKLRANVERDLGIDDQLTEMGWRLLHVWQHDLKDLAQAVWRVRLFLEEESPVETRRGSRESSGDVVAEPQARYLAAADPWYQCDCGSNDVRVLGVSDPGSLRPGSWRRPKQAELVCTRCRSKSFRSL